MISDSNSAAIDAGTFMLNSSRFTTLADGDAFSLGRNSNHMISQAGSGASA
jgi:hypothetical protein